MVTPRIYRTKSPGADVEKERMKTRPRSAKPTMLMHRGWRLSNSSWRDAPGAYTRRMTSVVLNSPGGDDLRCLTHFVRNSKASLCARAHAHACVALCANSDHVWVLGPYVALIIAARAQEHAMQVFFHVCTATCSMVARRPQRHPSPAYMLQTSSAVMAEEVGNMVPGRGRR